jgi:hypothetical protein
MLPDISTVVLVLELSAASAVLALSSVVAFMLPLVSPDMFMLDMSPDVFVLRRMPVLLRLRPRLRPAVFDVLPFCEVIIPPRVGSSCVVEELEFCADVIIKSALRRETEMTNTNKTVMLRVMLLLLTDVSPFYVLLRTYR